MFSFFSDYSWVELWGPGCLAAVTLISFLYFRKIVAQGKYEVARAQKIYFFVALGLVYLFKGSPFTVIAGDHLLSAHILSLSIILFVVPPLIISGLPAKFLRSLFWDYRRRIALKLLSHPWVTAIIFNGALSIYLVPGVFNHIHRHALFSFTAQLFLFITAFCMWWTIITPVPEVNKLSEFARMVYVFFTSLLLMPIGFFLLLMLDPHYSIFVEAEQRILPALTAVYDQQLAGGILKAIQLTAYGVALYYLIINLGKKEEEKEGEVEDKNVRIVQGIVIHLPDKK